MGPTVSVIIPTYNRRIYLPEAVDSVLKQTYPPTEIFVVDDGSTDGTEELFKKSSSNLRYLYQANQGVASARNLGISQAQGEWLAFLDSDDYWLPRKLEHQMEFHRKNSHYRISQTEETWIRNGTRVNPMKKHSKPSGWIFEPSLSLCLISPSSVLISREIFKQIGRFDESFPVCEDYEWWLRATPFFPIGLIRKALIVKRGGHADQLSKRYWGMDRFRIKAMEKTLRDLPLSREQRDACLKELEKKCRIYAQGCSKRNRRDEAKLFLDLLQKYKEHHAILHA